jgi:hypothetical protein
MTCAVQVFIQQTPYMTTSSSAPCIHMFEQQQLQVAASCCSSIGALTITGTVTACVLFATPAVALEAAELITMGPAVPAVAFTYITLMLLEGTLSGQVHASLPDCTEHTAEQQ